MKKRLLIRRLISHLKGWIKNSISIYVLVGLIIINLPLYYLYYSLALIFTEKLIFLFKVTGEEAFPFFGFYLSVIPPFIASYIIFLLTRVERLPVKIIGIFAAIILALSLTLTFIPLSITIFAAYLSLAGVAASISAFRHLIERFAVPYVKNEENKRAILKMKHDLLTTLLGYSIWGIITIVVAGLSVLMFNPAISEMIKLGGTRWIFAEGQSILCLSLMAYYSFGFMMGVTLTAFRKLLEIEEKLEKENQSCEATSEPT
jgi:hypothetical protein